MHSSVYGSFVLGVRGGEGLAEEGYEVRNIVFLSLFVSEKVWIRFKVEIISNDLSSLTMREVAVLHVLFPRGCIEPPERQILKRSMSVITLLWNKWLYFALRRLVQGNSETL